MATLAGDDMAAVDKAMDSLSFNRAHEILLTYAKKT